METNYPYLHGWPQKYRSAGMMADRILGARTLFILCGPSILLEIKMNYPNLHDDHRSTSLPESEPTENPATEPCLVKYCSMYSSYPACEIIDKMFHCSWPFWCLISLPRNRKYEP